VRVDGLYGSRANIGGESVVNGSRANGGGESVVHVLFEPLQLDGRVRWWSVAERHGPFGCGGR